MHNWVVPILMGTAALSLLLTLLTHALAHATLRRRDCTGGPTPPISILKPLRGLDEGLECNLRSLAEQDYPAYEILFAAEDPEDPALEVARQIKRAYPGIPVTILISDASAALNPKVANLIAMTRVARHPYLLVSDSNVRAPRHYLRTMAAETANPRVGLVSSVLAGTGEMNVGALLENAHLNSFILAAVCGGSVIRHPCVIGKSMLMRSADLASLGGWKSVGDLLAEDYVLGLRFKAAGFRIALSKHPLPTINVRWSVQRFLLRHLRWNQMRRRIAPAAYLLEPLLYPVPWLLLLIAITAFEQDGSLVSSPALVATAVLGVVVKAASDLLLSRRVRGHGFGLAAMVWMPVKDLLALALWGAGGVLRTVTWRGHELRIGAGSRLMRTPVAAVAVAAVAAVAAERWVAEAPAPE